MGVENATKGICGFTSTLYAVFVNHPDLQEKLAGALNDEDRNTQLMAEIKTFLQMMKAAGKDDILDGITQLTRSFRGYENWTIDWYIGEINKLTPFKYSIAMPPAATMEYMRSVWDMEPALTEEDSDGDVILGLARLSGPKNKWNNLAHYVYWSADGTIYSWGERFPTLTKLNADKGRDYRIVYRINVNA